MEDEEDVRGVWFVGGGQSPQQVPSPGAWEAPPGTRPGWDWTPDSGVSERGDRMPYWSRMWMLVPVADRWAHAHYWRQGGFDVEPAPGLAVTEDGWSTPPPGGWVRVRKHHWWGWDVITNTQGNWLVLTVPGALVGLLLAWALGAELRLGAATGAVVALLAVVVTVAADHQTAEHTPMTMGFGGMDGRAAHDLVTRLRADGIHAEVVPPMGTRNWRIELAPRDSDRARAIAGELGLI